MKKALPTGIMNYKELRMENYYTVDKTLMIKEFLERKSKVTLITRPRRFGKTLNMSMMAEFFDITKDSKALFEGLAIMDSEYAAQINTYPVIFLSFLDCKGNYDSMKLFLFESLRALYAQYQFIFEQDGLDDDLLKRVRKMYQVLKEQSCEMIQVVYALRLLSELLYAKYKVRPMIFIDEYDTPFVEAKMHGYYDQVRDTLSGLMRTTLKGNDNMQYAMLTGIQRIAKESVFSGLNNLKVCTVNDEQYAQYFGFTTEEASTFLKAYDLLLTDEVKAMYDGYHIGDYDIYNPWSIINYIDNQKLQPYWVNTSSNRMIKQAMQSASVNFRTEYETLIQTGSITTSVNLSTSFYEEADDASLWGLLVNAGYLTITRQYRKLCTLTIPNEEVQMEFQSLTLYYLNVSNTIFDQLTDALYMKQEAIFSRAYKEFLLQIPSYHDLESENSYHMLLLGLCAYLINDYELISNREAGHGRCDLILKAKRKELTSYVIEFKNSKEETSNLHQLAETAIQQIEAKRYDANLHGDVIYIGIAHCGKQAACIWKQQ